MLAWLGWCRCRIACISAGATVVSYTPGSLNVVIPSTVTINGNVYDVTKIVEGAFSWTPNLSSVTIPASVLVIEQGAFKMPAGSEVYFLGMTPPAFGLECVFGYQGSSVQLWYPHGATGYDTDQHFVRCGYTVGQARNSGNTVSFDSDGGSAVPSEDVSNGGTVSKPADPTKAGQQFAGWYIQDAAGNLVPYDFNTPVTSDITLVAKWNNVVPVPGNVVPAPLKPAVKDKDNAPGQTALARTGAGSQPMLLGAGGVLLLLGAAGATVAKRRQRSKA